MINTQFYKKQHINNEIPRCKQRGINRNIYNRPKGRGIKPLSASGLKGRNPCLPGSIESTWFNYGDCQKASSDYRHQY
jgi:hypothetical protein